MWRTYKAWAKKGFFHHLQWNAFIHGQQYYFIFSWCHQLIQKKFVIGFHSSPSYWSLSSPCSSPNYCYPSFTTQYCFDPQGSPKTARDCTGLTTIHLYLHPTTASCSVLVAKIPIVITMPPASLASSCVRSFSVKSRVINNGNSIDDNNIKNISKALTCHKPLIGHNFSICNLASSEFQEQHFCSIITSWHCNTTSITGIKTQQSKKFENHYAKNTSNAFISHITPIGHKFFWSCIKANSKSKECCIGYKISDCHGNATNVTGIESFRSEY